MPEDESEDSDGNNVEETSLCGGKELEIYLAEGVVRLDSFNLDLIKYWQKNVTRFPVMAKFALDTLTAQATSVPCEQLFFKAGLVVNKRRSMLSPDSVQAVLCLSSWRRKCVCVKEDENSSSSELIESESEDDQELWT
ncbi:hypothetical protein GEMRC1_004466 [Eukaryota sp. GEM-RC1]